MRYTLHLFILISVVHMVGETFQHDIVQYTKPFLMPSLALWWWHQSEGNKVRYMVLGALLFSTVGDILLMRAGQYAHYFLLGLGAFLVAHLCYIYTFRVLASGQKGFIAQKPYLLLPFLVYLAVLLGWLWGNIPIAMKGAVAVYGLTISAMAAMALHLNGVLPPDRARWLFLGAVLFVLSDSLIAINKFGYTFPESRVAIMSTYIYGQYAIVRALINPRV